MVSPAIEYAIRLEREGVRVVHLHYTDQIHGFMSMNRMIRAADQAIDVMAHVLKQTPYPPPPVS